MAWLMRRHMRFHMDQFDLYKMKLKHGWGYITFSLGPIDGSTGEHYSEIKLGDDDGK